MSDTIVFPAGDSEGMSGPSDKWPPRGSVELGGAKREHSKCQLGRSGTPAGKRASWLSKQVEDGQAGRRVGVDEGGKKTT